MTLHGTSNHHSNTLNVPVNIPWKIGITHFTSFICSNLYFQIHLLTMKMTLNNQNSFRNGLSSQNHCTCRGGAGPLWSGDQRGGSGRVTLIRWWFDIATLTVDYRIHVSCSLRNYPADTYIRSPGAVSVLAQHHRRWAGIESALGRRLVYLFIIIIYILFPIVHHQCRIDWI